MSGRSLTACELDHWLLSCLQTQSETMALPGLWACWSLDWNYTICSSGSQALGLLLELNNWLSWISSLPIHPADLGACQTVYMYKPIPCNKSIHTHTHRYPIAGIEQLPVLAAGPPSILSLISCLQFSASNTLLPFFTFMLYCHLSILSSSCHLLKRSLPWPSLFSFPL